MLEFETRTLDVKINGDIHKLNYPNRKQIVPILSKLKDAENDPAETLNLAAGLLTELGLPVEITDSLEVEHIVKIFEAVQGKKK